MKIYLDGALVDFVVFPNGQWAAPNQTPFYLMGQSTNFDKCIEGHLNDLRISTDIYNNIDNELTLNGINQNLLAHWNFNEGEGTTLTDLSGNGNHGTIYGATWSTNVPFQPQTRAELQAAVDLWEADNATALSTYGEINYWDVSLITDMNQLFRDKPAFNEAIKDWDVSNVTDMGKMFWGAIAFNQDLSTWDVSSVTDMGNMFRNTEKF